MACLLLSNDTELTIEEAIFSPRSVRTLLSFKNIRENNYCTKITEKWNEISFHNLLFIRPEAYLGEMECLTCNSPHFKSLNYHNQIHNLLYHFHNP